MFCIYLTLATLATDGGRGVGQVWNDLLWSFSIDYDDDYDDGGDNNDDDNGDGNDDDIGHFCGTETIYYDSLVVPSGPRNSWAFGNNDNLNIIMMMVIMTIHI